MQGRWGAPGLRPERAVQGSPLSRDPPPPPPPHPRLGRRLHPGGSAPTVTFQSWVQVGERDKAFCKPAQLAAASSSIAPYTIVYHLKTI